MLMCPVCANIRNNFQFPEIIFLLGYVLCEFERKRIVFILDVKKTIKAFY